MRRFLARRAFVGLALALGVSPGLAQAAEEHGRRCADSKPDLAITACSAILGEPGGGSETRAEAYIIRGYAYGAKGLYDKALADLSEAILLKPDALAYHGRAVAYERQGHYDQAIADDTKAVALKPDWVDAYENRGVAYDQKGLYDQAVADYTKALSLSPNVAQTYFNRGAAYEHRRAYDKALQDYRAALKLDPSLKAPKDGLKRLGGAH